MSAHSSSAWRSLRRERRKGRRAFAARKREAIPRPRLNKRGGRETHFQPGEGPPAGDSLGGRDPETHLPHLPTFAGPSDRGKVRMSRRRFPLLAFALVCAALLVPTA